MKLLEEILSYNEKFVEDKEYEKFERSKFPNKKLVILSCMDTRLVELLPKSMNLGNGDVKIVKNAGALVSHPYGSIMRSLLVGVYELQADEVCVIGHHDCGMTSLNTDSIMGKIEERGVSPETVDTIKNSGIELEQFLKGFDNVEESVENTTATIRNHPLMPKDVPVHGLVISPETGKLDLVVDGYQK